MTGDGCHHTDRESLPLRNLDAEFGTSFRTVCAGDLMPDCRNVCFTQELRVGEDGKGGLF